MPFVLKRDDGWYVRRPGAPTSYIPALEQARTFGTREQADAERKPENETIYHTDDLLQPVSKEG